MELCGDHATFRRCTRIRFLREREMCEAPIRQRDAVLHHQRRGFIDRLKREIQRVFPRMKIEGERIEARCALR